MDVNEACLVLEICPDDATPDSVRKAYKRLCLRHHPDKNLGREDEAKETFQRISAAYSAMQHHFGKRGDSGQWRESAGTQEGSGGCHSKKDWSWEEAQDLFRETFGVEFKDMAAAAVVTASEYFRDGAAVASLRASEGVTSNKLAVQYASRRVVSDELAVNSAWECIVKAEKDLFLATEQHQNAILANARYVPGPTQRVEYECGGAVGSVLAVSICVTLISDPIIFLVCFFLILICLMGITFEVETEESHRKRAALAGTAVQAKNVIEAQKLDLSVAQEALARANAKLFKARRDLAEAKSPATQCLNIASALFGINQSRDRGRVWDGYD